MLREGHWERKVDEKGRVPLPTAIRPQFGAIGTWAVEPSGQVVLYPARAWKEVLKGVEDLQLQQFRETWEPHDEEIDQQGRITVPFRTRRKLRGKITLVSMGEYLKIFPGNGVQSNNLGRSFQNVQAAEEYLREGKEVIYLSGDRRKVVGRFTAVVGSFFGFSGKDEQGIIVTLYYDPYWNFYPG